MKLKKIFLYYQKQAGAPPNTGCGNIKYFRIRPSIQKYTNPGLLRGYERRHWGTGVGPGFVLAFFVCGTEFVSTAWAKKRSGGLVHLKKPFFSAKLVIFFFAKKNPSVFVQRFAPVFAQPALLFGS